MSSAETRFIDQVYEAAIEPGLWPAVLEGVADVMDGISANLTFQDQVSGKGRATVFVTDPAPFDDYFG
ncbi:MAG TPA: hypothetical protein VGF97_12365 [Rhizomicrobium sp.]